jgi:hypothetical protein
MQSSLAWKKLAKIEERDMSPSVARMFLALGFNDAVGDRVERLSKKAQAGTLTSKESAELFQWVEANDLLTLLRLRARRALKNQMRRA